MASFPFGKDEAKDIRAQLARFAFALDDPDLAELALNLDAEDDDDDDDDEFQRHVAAFANPQSHRDQQQQTEQGRVEEIDDDDDEEEEAGTGTGGAPDLTGLNQEEMEMISYAQAHGWTSVQHPKRVLPHAAYRRRVKSTGPHVSLVSESQHTYAAQPRSRSEADTEGMDAMGHAETHHHLPLPVLDVSDSAFTAPDAHAQELEELQIAHERELQAHIETAEALERMEAMCEKEKKAREDAHAALVDAMARCRLLQADVEAARRETAQLATQHEAELKSVRQYYLNEVAAAQRETQYVQQLRQAEASVLRARIDSLTHDLAALTWTERHVAEAQAYGAEEVFCRLLAAQSAAACDGLATRLGELAASAEEWVAQSGWEQRLCHHVEAMQGGGTSTAVCRAIATQPALYKRLFGCGLVACLADVAALDPRFTGEQHEEHHEPRVISLYSSWAAEPQDTQLLSAARFARTAAEWGAIRINIAKILASMLQADPRRDPDRIVTAFLGEGRAVDLLARLTLEECGRDAHADAELLQLCAGMLETICAQMVAIEGLGATLRSRKCATALIALLHTPQRTRALACLLKLCTDVVACEDLVAQGILRPLAAALLGWTRHPRAKLDPEESEHAVAAEYSDEAWEAAPAEDRAVIERAVQLLVPLSRVSTFAPAFIALEGHRALIRVVRSLLSPAARCDAVETLLNLLFNTTDIDAVVLDLGAFNTLLAVSLGPDASVAVSSRALDVASRLLSMRSRLAQDVPQSALLTLASLVARDHAAFSYKASFFLQAYARAPRAVLEYLADDRMLRCYTTLAGLFSGEVRAWLADALSALVTRLRDLWAGTNTTPFTSEQRAQLMAAVLPLMRDDVPAPARAVAGEACVALLLHQWQTGDKEAVLAVQSDAPRVAWIIRTLDHVAAPHVPMQLFAEMAAIAELTPFLCAAGSFLQTTLAAHTDVPVVDAAAALCLALWEVPRIRTEGTLAALTDAGLLDLFINVARLEGPRPFACADRVLHLAHTPEVPDFAVLLAGHGGLGAVARMMKVSTENFRAGAAVLTHLLRVPALTTAVLSQAGLAQMLAILRFSADESVQRAVADVLPPAFDREDVCMTIASTGVVSHLVALIDTAPSPLELVTALRIIVRLVHFPKAALNFVRHDGLRVLVEMAIMQQFAPDSDMLADAPPAELPILRAATCLERIFAQGKDMSVAIAEEGATPVVLRLLEDTDSDMLIEACLRCLRDVACTPQAGDLLLTGGLRLVARWCAHNPAEDVIRPAEWSERVRTLACETVVDTAWNVQTGPRGQTAHDTLTVVIGQAGLAPFIQSCERHEPANAEVKRKALWGLSTWMTMDDAEARASFIRTGGMPCLLQIDESNSTVEMCRYARMALSKLLGALGEELTIRTQLLRAQLAQGDLQPLWNEMSANIAGGGMAGGEMESRPLNPPEGQD